MRKEDVDVEKAVVWIPDSKTPTGVAEVPLTELAIEAFRDQMALGGPGSYLFPNSDSANGYQASFKKVWTATLRKAGVPDLRSTIDLCHAPERRRRRRRVGHPASPTRGLEGVQEVLTNATADEKRGARETKPPC